MTTFKKQVTIDVSKRQIWNVVSNLGDIYKYHPGVRKSYYTTDKVEQVGAARICELQPAGKILETVKSWEEGNGFLLEIEGIEKVPPVKEFTGQFQLEQVDKNVTLVSLTISYKMKLGLIGDLLNKLIIRSKMEEGIDALLSGLKVHTEMGLDIKDIRTLQNLLKVA